MPNKTSPPQKAEDWERINRIMDGAEEADKEAKDKAEAMSKAEIEATALLHKLGVKGQAASPSASSNSGTGSGQGVDFDLSGPSTTGGGSSSGGGRKSSGGGGGGSFDMNSALDKYFPMRLMAIFLAIAGLIALFINLRVEENRARDSDPIKMAREKTAQDTIALQSKREETKQKELEYERIGGAGNTQSNPCVINLGILKGSDYGLPKECKAILFVHSKPYPVTRFHSPWPIKKAEGRYALFDQGNGPLLCQTENPSGELYSSNGCQEVLEKLVFPRQLKLARMTTSVTITPR